MTDDLDIKNKKEEYKKEINRLTNNSEDLEYLIALFTFADTYPDKSKEISRFRL